MHMYSFLITGAIIGYGLSIKFPEQIDAKWLKVWSWMKEKLNPTPSPTSDFLHLLLLNRILSILRSGISLQNALEDASQDPNTPRILQNKIKNLLSGFPENDFLSQFFYTAMETGVSCISTIQSLQKIFRVKIKIRQKINSASSQAAAQAAVLSWLPWAMAFLVGLMDPTWFGAAIKNPISWFLWSISLALIGLGKVWFEKIIERALLPQSPIENLLENTFPELLIRVISNIAIGKDAQSALEISLANCEDPLLNQQIISNQNPEPIVHFKSILQQANRGAIGLRDELLALLQDIHSAQEAKWEENAQKIPVKLMAPLFICFFPSTVLVLVGLLIASIGQFL